MPAGDKILKCRSRFRSWLRVCLFERSTRASDTDFVPHRARTLETNMAEDTENKSATSPGRCDDVTRLKTAALICPQLLGGLRSDAEL